MIFNVVKMTTNNVSLLPGSGSAVPICAEYNIESLEGRPDPRGGTLIIIALIICLCSRNIENTSDESEDELARIRERARFPDTTRLEKNDITVVTKYASGIADQNASITPVIQRRALKPHGFSNSEKCKIKNSRLPNKPCIIQEYGAKVFCGSYSKDGKFFITATQDKWLYIYRTHNGNFILYNRMLAHDVGWSVLDIAFSPDGEHFAYSSWADCLYQCHISGHSLETLPLTPGVRRFCVFSVAFSNDGTEILGGANDNCLYIYDLECQQRILRFEGHEEDVNSVTFADDSSQIFYSASDDGLCKVWDRRMINESNPHAAGVLAGHRDGITYIDSRGDTRYFITNSKDQSIKLWDTRVFSNHRAQHNARQIIDHQDWDYRWQPVPKRLWERGFLDGDTSVMTYYGHSVRKTLIRCHFSPPDNTGQKYICTGDSTGRFIIYDLLTGKIVRKIKAHTGCVRDISWHPFDQTLITSSWDGKIAKWEYCEGYNVTNEDELRPPLRRSQRIAAQRRARGLNIILQKDKYLEVAQIPTDRDVTYSAARTCTNADYESLIHMHDFYMEIVDSHFAKTKADEPRRFQI